MSCVKSCMICGSETWMMKVAHEVNTDRSEISMIGWMCRFMMEGGEERCWELLGLEPVGLLMMRSRLRLRWLGRVEH